MSLQTWEWATAILAGLFAGLVMAGAILVASFYFLPD
jgi:hypothetical protein